MKKAISILSGGLDSSVATAIAMKEMEISFALTFDYGQKALHNEIEASKALSNKWNIEHRVIRLDFLSDIGKSSLTGIDREISQISVEELDDKSKTDSSLKNVWVPNRNGIFINIAAGIAESEEIDYIITGFNKEEAETFSDNSSEFVQRANETLELSTQNSVKLISPTLNMSKADILKEAIRLELNIEKLWPCYLNSKQWCGKCESCSRFKRAMQKIGVFEKYENLFYR